jgi:hypothetical protein
MLASCATFPGLNVPGGARRAFITALQLIACAYDPTVKFKSIAKETKGFFMSASHSRRACKLIVSEFSAKGKQTRPVVSLPFRSQADQQLWLIAAVWVTEPVPGLGLDTHTQKRI